MKWARRLACLACLAVSLPSHAADQTVTVNVIASHISDVSMAEVSDLADALAEGGELRLVPMASRGPVEALRDLLALEGVDAAVVAADAAAFAADNGLIANPAQRLRYIAKTGSADLHILAAAGIRSLADLRGKRVSIGLPSERRYITAQVVLGRLGIEFIPVDVTLVEAIELLKAGGLEAIVLMQRKPSPVLQGLTKKDGVHFIPLVGNAALASVYAPQILTDSDYPFLIAKGESVPTLSAADVLVALNWAKGSTRDRKIRALTDSLFANAELLQQGARLAEWQDVNFAASVPGWTRHAAAERNIGTPPAAPVPDQETAEEFRAFLTAENLTTGTSGNSEAELFERFLAWKHSKSQGD